jgi:polar amino acid transport system substrate-binding protein
MWTAQDGAAKPAAQAAAGTLAAIVAPAMPASAVATAAPAAGALLFAVNDWCPYSCAADPRQPGILIELVTEIFAAQGLTPSFVRMPLARGVEAARSGGIAGLVGIIPAVAPDLVFPSEAAIQTQFCFFTASTSSWTFGGFQRRYREVALGIASGKATDARLAQAFPAVSRISGATPTERMVAMLELRRLDALLEDRVSVQYVLARERLAPLRNAGCLERKGEYVAFSPASAQAAAYARIFSDGMLRLRASGRLEHIVETYTGER